MNPIEGEPARPAFILSCERSGSTLLRWIVDAHADVASPGEILLARLCFDLYVTLSRTIVKTADVEGRLAVNAATVARVRGIVDGIMIEYARARGARVWCDKTPSNLEHISVLVETFPDARYVCLYRDALDVAYSCLKISHEGFMAELVDYVRRSPHDLVAAMLESWAEKTTLLLKMQLNHPAICHRVRYEDLVARPEEVLPPLFAFLGVDWDPALLRQTFHMRHDDGGGDPLILGTREIERLHLGHGRSLDTHRLPDALRTRVNSLQRNLGYAEIPPPPPSVRD